MTQCFGWRYNTVRNNSCQSSIIGGCCNEVYGSVLSSILGGCCNCLDGGYATSIISGCCNCVGFSYYSTIVGGYCNQTYCSVSSNIIGGYYNCSIFSCNSTVVGGYCNCISGYYDGGAYFYCNSSIIGGYCNCIHNSHNSVILGGCCETLSGRDNTILLNGTTQLQETVEKSMDDVLDTTPFTINFTEGGVRYFSSVSVSTDFVISFTNVPVVANTTLTYTIILNDSSYTISSVNINNDPFTIKWAGGTEPSPNPGQVDIIGLMFIVNGSGNIANVLGQSGTFA